MPCDITRDLPPAGRVADMDGVAEVQMLDDGSRVGGVVVHIVAVRHLARPPVAAAINADHPVALLDKKQHLSVPVVGTERPAMVEDNRLATPPVFVEDLCAVVGCDRAHGLDSVAAVGSGFCEGRLRKLAAQSRTAFSNIAWDTRSSSQGEELMTRSTSAVAFSRSSASSCSRVCWSNCSLRL